MYDTIYEPREDTYLLGRAVSRYAHGRVLDMGTGSGYLAHLAARKAKRVVAVDINPEAIAYCRKQHHDRNITFIESNLFSACVGPFDTIIFNPPYLPYDKREPLQSRLITTGGKHGYELLVRFIQQSSRYLSSRGVILIVFSSLTNKEKIDEVIMQSLLEKEMVMMQRIPHEQLYVYRITKTPVYTVLEKTGVTELAFFAKGKRGLVFTGQLGNKTIAAKVHHPMSRALEALAREARMLNVVNKLGIGPKLLGHGKWYVLYEFVPGEQFRYRLPSMNKDNLKKFFKSLLLQLLMLDKHGIAKEEMSNPYKHIIVDGAKPVLLDFERAHKTKRPHNVTQFCSYLLRLQPLLVRKKIRFSRNAVIAWAKNYRPQQQYLNKLLRILFSHGRTL
ncbi:methyltransferase [Candidatus Woesearchaeota archaeon]|nr:methyltransferase [Candidatus Woesearchaeota archaeon]